MWWRITVLALLLVGAQAPGERPKDRAPVGTRAEAATAGLPEAIVERIRVIEAKERPRGRPWKGREAEELMARPGFEQAERFARERAARLHHRLADELGLQREERARFLKLHEEANEARLRAVAFVLKQGSDYPGRIRELAEADKLPEELRRADPRATHRKVRKLLGEERYTAYLELRDKPRGGKTGEAR